jgi:hypothetical protein
VGTPRLNSTEAAKKLHPRVQHAPKPSGASQSVSGRLLGAFYTLLYTDEGYSALAFGAFERFCCAALVVEHPSRWSKGKWQTMAGPRATMNLAPDL